MRSILARIPRFALAPLFVVASALPSAQPAYAASGYTLFGDASLTAGHNSPTGVQLRSGATAPGYAGIDFAVPAGLTLADLSSLSAEFFAAAGGCGGGSPRFQVNVGTLNVFVYLGALPDYTCGTGSWLSSGNLIGSGFLDTSQLGGAFYDTYAHAVATYGTLPVTGIQLVVDSGWKFGGTETVIVDNVVIDGTTYTFESAQSCKDDGWKSFGSAPGPFKNQGDCVSYFATNGRNAAQ